MLTRHRLRAHAFIFAAALWSVYVWNISAPGLRDRAGNLKGTDFLHFYTLGSLALAHDGSDLYEMQAQAAVARRRVPDANGILYLPLYPPQVSVLFAPFAKLSYGAALTSWLVLSAFIYSLCCFAVWRTCSSLLGATATVFLAALGFPAFWHLIAWGQTSAIALGLLTLAFLALRGQHEFLAGLAFGGLIFKPQLGLAAALIFLATLRWRVILGALLSAAAELCAGLAYYGVEPLRQWLRMMWNTPALLSLLEPRTYQTHCLRTFWSMLIPSSGVAGVLYLLTTVLVAALAISIWKSALPLSLRYSGFLFATVLLSPHLTVYDLVILAPAFLFLADYLCGSNDHDSAKLKPLLYATYLSPLIGPLAMWTHVQLSVVLMCAVMFVLWKIGRRSTAGAEAIRPRHVQFARAPEA
ncbi:MAG TPA: glycosyltransferase family 87 protein [Candidatus Binatia bacterium]|nr:glycosyltransferase family 87 protein [Candidatus Binatia bacterium]